MRIYRISIGIHDKCLQSRMCNRHYNLLENCRIATNDARQGQPKRTLLSQEDPGIEGPERVALGLCESAGSVCWFVEQRPFLDFSHPWQVRQLHGARVRETRRQRLLRHLQKRHSRSGEARPDDLAQKKTSEIEPMLAKSIMVARGWTHRSRLPCANVSTSVKDLHTLMQML